MAGGMPPPPEGEMPPLPPIEGDEGGGSDDGVTSQDAQTVEKIQDRTLDLVRKTLQMVGKAKSDAEMQGDAAEAPPTPPPAEAPAPEQQPGPITGQPGLDPAALGGPLKLGAALKRKLAASSCGGSTTKKRLRRMKRRR